MRKSARRRRTLAFVGVRQHAAVALALSLSAGCQRGCLATWLADHGVAGAEPGRAQPSSPGPGGPSPRGSRGQGLELGAVDCVSGLARCRDGHVEVSLAGQVPSPCTAPKERPNACACPWEPAGTCASSCVQDDLEVVAAPDVASQQLCASGPLLLRPPTKAEAADAPVCADEAVSCEDGKIRACARRGQPAALVGVCVNGCASGVALEPEDLLERGPGDTLRASGAATILCRRDQTERR